MDDPMRLESPVRPGMRRFNLVRHVDHNGMSGTGVVVEGVQFSSGQCVMQWLGEYAHINVAPSIESVISVHGHGGDTVVMWIDDPAGQKEED